jgi:hypothetical protein
MNTNYFFKSKGTRQAIEAVFAMIGAPDSMIEFNEHVYIAEDRVIRFEDDEDEYPIPYQNYFQELDDDENGKNVYIEDFKERGFNLNKIVDNKKSSVNENKFLINSKEVSLNLSSVKPIEYDIYKTKNTSLTLVEYLWELYSTHVSIKDNKLAYDHMTQSYPTMFEAILEYYRTTNNVMTFKKVIRYAIKFGGLWFKFINQFIPATTIITEGGIGIRNTAFTPQKFKYRTSDDTGCVFMSTQTDPMNYDLNIISMEGFFSEGVNNDDDAIIMQSSTGEATTSDSTIVSNNYSYVTSQVVNEPSVSGSYTIIKVPQITTLDVVKLNKNAISGSVTVPFKMGVDTKKDIEFTIDSITNVKLFGFTIHEYAPSYGYFRSEVIHKQEFNKSQMTTNVIRATIPAMALKPDTEYLVKPYFILNEDISTKDDLSYHDSPYGIYRDFTDFYFPSIKVPNRPYVYIGSVIQRDYNIASSENTVTESFTINDTLITKETNELKISLNNEVRENSLIVKLNGISLTRGVDFMQSPIDEKIVLIKNAATRNGELSVLYIIDDSNSIIYDLPAGNNIIEWDIDDKIKSSEKGYFTVDFAEDITESFGVSEYQIRKNYVYNTTTFSEMLNTSLLRSGIVYKARVTSNKTMQTLTGEVVISKVYSDYYKIRIP